jgi:tyrosyl-tRNA synthetase
MDEMPVTEISAGDLTDGKADIKVLLVKAGLCKSNSEARQNITQGGVSLNGEKVTDIYLAVSEADLRQGVLLKRGKKSFGKVVLK